MALNKHTYTGRFLQAGELLFIVNTIAEAVFAAQ